MSTIKAFIKRHPVSVYFALTFAISWGGFLAAIGGLGGLPGKGTQFDTLMPMVVTAMLAGPTIAGLLMTGLVYGKAGFRELLSRLLKWKVNIHWYAIAILPVPLLALTLIFALSLTCPIFTADNKIAILISGIFAGLSTVFEEIGWTGFAIPRLRLRYNILKTGLIVGVLWAMWHLLQITWVSGSYTGDLPLTVFLPLYFLSSIAQLTPFRVLMVWVYDRTKSLLVATVMHASLTGCTIFILAPIMAGTSFLVYAFALAAAFWILVAAVKWRKWL